MGETDCSSRNGNGQDEVTDWNRCNAVATRQLQSGDCCAAHTHAPESVNLLVNTQHSVYTFWLSQLQKCAFIRGVVSSRASLKGSFNSILEGLEISLIGDRRAA